MLKVLKIRSVENAVYTPQYNRMRFKVPMDNLNTHLSESYLSLLIQPVESTGAEVSNTANIGFGNSQTGLYYPTCLLKTVRLFRGDSNIPLEEVQNFNILDQNLKLYQKDIENLGSEQFEGGFFFEDVFQSDKSSFWLEGKAEVHIPLSEIFGICKNKDFYLSDVGGLQIEFELEDRYSLFIENKSDDLQQSVLIALDPADVVNAPSISNKNNNYQSLTSNASDIPVDNSLSVLYKEVQAVPSDNNFYLAIDNTTEAISALNTTTELYTLTLKVNPTQTIITNNTIQPNIKAYGINSAVANTAFKTTDYLRLPVQIVYKKGATSTLTSSADIYGMPAILTGYTDWSTGSPPTKATVTLTTPIAFDVSNNQIFAIAFIQNLADASDTQRFIPLAITNAVSTDIPASLTRFGTSPTLASIDAINSSLTLSTGNSAVRTLTINPTVFPSGITPVQDQLYEIYFQAHGGLGTDSRVSVQIEYQGDPNINQKRYLKCGKAGIAASKRMRLKCIDYTNGVFSFINVNDNIPPNPTSVQIEAYNKGIDSALASKLFNKDTTIINNVAVDLYGKIFLRRIYDYEANQYTAVEQSTLSYNIPRAELVLVQSGKQSSDDVSKTYSTWKMEPTLIENTTSNWQHQFILEPNVYNSLLVSPENLSSATATMISLTDGLTNYRWALDNIDNTNRDVVVNQALHYDKLIDTFNNGDIKLHNLNNDVLMDKETNSIAIVPMKIYTARDNQNVYMNNTSHTLQVTLKSSDNVLTPKNLFLYKQILKAL